MSADLPPVPDGPPIPDVVYTPAEAVAWIRTMTPAALVKAARRDPERFPSTKPGREVGFSGDNITAINANTSRAAPKPSGRRSASRPARRRTPSVADSATSGVTELRPRPERARRARRAS